MRGRQLLAKDSDTREIGEVHAIGESGEGPRLAVTSFSDLGAARPAPTMDPEIRETKEAVLKRDIPWETYMTAKLITGTGLQLLRRYDHKPYNVQAGLLEEDGVAYVRVFVGILRDISKEETVEYVLAIVDDMLSANPKRAKLFHDKSLANEDVYEPFLRLLSKKKWFIQETSCKILTLVISARPKQEDYISGEQNGKKPMSPVDKTQRALVDWLSEQMKHPSNTSRAVPTAVSSLATLLRERSVRPMFERSGGVKALVELISPASSQQHIQMLYEATLSVWLLSFYEPAAHALIAARVVPRLVEVVKVSSKEKVVRVSLLTIKNLDKLGSCGSDLVELGVLKVIQNLRLQAWTDEDLKQALDDLEVSIKESSKNLNSFDKYKREVSSGNLDWTPVHKDPTFWKENCKKFEDDDYQVLRILITTLDQSRDPKTLAVACQDLSQFIGNHPNGRGIVADLKAKEKIMRLMAHDNPDVAREALLCVQKILLSAKYQSYMQ